MVTPRNDSIELSVVKEKYPAPSAPPPDEYVNGTAFEKSGSKRPRKRCWTVVTLVVVVLVAIGAGTILFYEHLLGWLPAESNGHGPLPEVREVVGTTSRVPDLVDPYPEEPRSSSSSTTTTEVIFIDSTTDGEQEEHIFIDSQEESVESSSAEDRTTSEEEEVSSVVMVPVKVLARGENEQVTCGLNSWRFFG
ncbi:hypothetical protein pipiens_005648 [Culex pipiens pipiens]|uniref:Uncharacterized protein n=1 Tax=Culex pipiens pipiens TaxID=38569 RepID=A0ABD1DUV5_CULPP